MIDLPDPVIEYAHRLLSVLEPTQTPPLANISVRPLVGLDGQCIDGKIVIDAASPMYQAAVNGNALPLAMLLAHEFHHAKHGSNERSALASSMRFLVKHRGEQSLINEVRRKLDVLREHEHASDAPLGARRSKQQAAKDFIKPKTKRPEMKNGHINQRDFTPFTNAEGRICCSAVYNLCPSCQSRLDAMLDKQPRSLAEFAPPDPYASDAQKLRDRDAVSEAAIMQPNPPLRPDSMLPTDYTPPDSYANDVRKLQEQNR